MAEGRRQVGPGQTIAADWGNAVWDQSVQTFTSAADRDNQFPNPQRGAVTYLEDLDRVEIRGATSWMAIAQSNLTSIRVGQAVASTNAAGGYYVPFGVTYRTIPRVMLSAADSNADVLIAHALNAPQVTTVGFGAIARDVATGQAYGGAVRVNYLVAGSLA